MKLIDCYIENFGKLSDFKLSFSDGLNTVKKDNGYGKTTLTVFIKAMLYGLDDTKKVKLEENDRKHYMPWQGGRCGGSLTFECEGRKYRIERTFMPKASDDTFTLYDVKGGKVSNDFSEKVGEELFGIDSDGFERTVFLSEANLSGKNENKTVSAKLSNLIGYDGDLSVMDEAVTLLEKERKLIYRRGGAGEIGDIKAKRIETERRLSDLERLADVYKDEEERLEKIKSELDRAYIEKKRMAAEARLADEARLKRTYEKQYAEMKSSIDADERSLSALKLFFKNGLPASEEITGAKEMHAEAKRIFSAAEKEKDPELEALSDFFRCGAADEEFLAAKETGAKLQEKQKEAEIIEKALQSTGQEEDCRASNAGTADDFIEKLSSLKSANKVKKSWHITIPGGIILIALGIGLGILINPVMLIASAVGILLLALGAKNAGDVKKSDTVNLLYDAANDFIQSAAYPKASGTKELLCALYEIKSREKAEEEKKRERSQSLDKLKSLQEEITNLTRNACEFIAKFPKTNALTVVESIDEILKRRDIYLALSEREAAAIKRKEADLARAEEYRRLTEEFLSRFPTSTDKPFDEINEKLVEYSTITRSIDRMKESIRSYADEHGINPDAITEWEAEKPQLSYDTTAIEERIAELERNKAVCERQCKTISDELILFDELQAERDTLAEKEKAYEKKLDVILKTQKYLSEAKDSLTSKYLSKTKAAFDKYVNLISREDSEDFHMDTSFAVMKNEKGVLKGAEAYSRGTRDTYALATRFALIDSLYENESPFVILDDPFAYLDDAKLSRAASAISALAKEKQIIYLTCSSARKI